MKTMLKLVVVVVLVLALCWLAKPFFFPPEKDNGNNVAQKTADEAESKTAQPQPLDPEVQKHLAMTLDKIQLEFPELQKRVEALLKKIQGLLRRIEALELAYPNACKDQELAQKFQDLKAFKPKNLGTSVPIEKRFDSVKLTQSELVKLEPKIKEAKLSLKNRENQKVDLVELLSVLKKSGEELGQVEELVAKFEGHILALKESAEKVQALPPLPTGSIKPSETLIEAIKVAEAKRLANIEAKKLKDAELAANAVLASAVRKKIGESDLALQYLDAMGFIRTEFIENKLIADSKWYFTFLEQRLLYMVKNGGGFATHKAADSFHEELFKRKSQSLFQRKPRGKDETDDDIRRKIKVLELGARDDVKELVGEEGFKLLGSQTDMLHLIFTCSAYYCPELWLSNNKSTEMILALGSSSDPTVDDIRSYFAHERSFPKGYIDRKNIELRKLEKKK